MAEGMRMLHPGGRRMTRPRSQRMRWPPRSGLNFPSAVMTHQPNARLPESVWGKDTVKGPKLIVIAAKTVFGLLRRSKGFHWRRSWRYFL